MRFCRKSVLLFAGTVMTAYDEMIQSYKEAKITVRENRKEIKEKIRKQKTITNS